MEEKNDTIPRNVAKWLLAATIDLTVTRVVANTADNYTRFDKDSIAVKLGAGAVGMVVAANLKPVTDQVVDKSADFIVEQRIKFQAKRNAKKDKKD